MRREDRQEDEVFSCVPFESPVVNHHFVRFNKRVTFCATDVLLRVNGWKLAVDPMAAHAFIIGPLERGRCD